MIDFFVDLAEVKTVSFGEIWVFKTNTFEEVGILLNIDSERNAFLILNWITIIDPFFWSRKILLVMLDLSFSHLGVEFWSST